MMKLRGSKKEGRAVETRFPFTGTQIQKGTLLERYPLNTPFAYAAIVDDQVGTRRYYLDELTLDLKEASVYTQILDKLESELTIPRSRVDPKRYFTEQAKLIATKYGLKSDSVSWSKILYFAERDLVGFGILDAMLKDSNIEDITIDGIGKPVFVYHRKYESLGTNITFNTDSELDNLISRLAHMAGKHISTAFPILQGTLPGRHRLMATFRREISPYGSTLTLRKFREDPLTVIDLLNYKVIDYRMGAYVWLMMENKMSSLVAGATGSGKTTLLNALLTLTRASSKVVTIEEVQEINIPHFNWTALVARESYGAGGDVSGQINLFDLVKAAMRMRPDILVVGEVRGEEAYVLFQAISSVAGETPVLIREGGDVRLTPIGEFVDRFYLGDFERMPVPVRGVEALTFDRGGKVLFKPVNYLLRHKADTIYNIRYNGGEVRATGNHSVFVFDENCDLVEEKVSELQSGDLLASFSGSQVPMERQVVDAEGILRKLTPDKVVSEKVLPRCPFCRSVSIWRNGREARSQRYMCKECKRTFRGTREGLEFSNRLKQSNGTELVSFVNSFAVPKRMEVDERFAKVLGIYMADGCVKHHRGSRIVFSLGTPEKSLFINDLVEFFSTFGSKPSIDDRGTYSIVEFNHTPLALVFEALCGRELSEKRMPPFIWTSPPSVIDAFLQGWTADATRTLKGKVESYSSARPDLVNAISWLARLNDRTSIITERSSKYRCANISRSGVEQKSKAIPNLPLIALKKALNSTAWYYGPDSRKRMISKARARKALQDILQKKRISMTWEAAKLVSKISSLLEGSLIATPVRNVSKAKFDGFVYDLSVPDTEAFFGGESPVALHNTGHGGISTVHADDVDSVIQRLTSKPMDVPASFIPFLDLVFTVRRIAIPLPGGGFGAVRRVVSVDEVVGVNQYYNIFKWNPANDSFKVALLRESPKLNRLSRDLGIKMTELGEELNRRALVLRWLQEKNVRNFRDVSSILEEYASHPKVVIERVMKELGATRTESAPADGFQF